MAKAIWKVFSRSTPSVDSASMLRKIHSVGMVTDSRASSASPYESCVSSAASMSMLRPSGVTLWYISATRENLPVPVSPMTISDWCCASAAAISAHARFHSGD